MTDIIPLFTVEANKIADGYITPIRKPNTIQEMAKRVSSVNDNLPNINSDFVKLANELIEKYEVTVTDELKSKLKEVTSDILRRITKTNLTG